MYLLTEFTVKIWHRVSADRSRLDHQIIREIRMGKFLQNTGLAVQTLLAASALLLTACSDSGIVSLTSESSANDAGGTRILDMMSGASSNIVGTAVAADDFTILAAALEATGLGDDLADADALFTVFAPTDEAFRALGQETIDSLLADTEKLRDILLYHVIAERVIPAETAVQLAGTTATTANGDDIAISVEGDQLRINMSNVIAADIFATNGIIHAIDAVLLPPADEPVADQVRGSIVEVASAAGFNTLTLALQATGLDAVLADADATFTVFAPTDEAFSMLGDKMVAQLLADPETLGDILLYHVIPEQAVDAATALSLTGQSITMANGDALPISVRESSLFVGDSMVTATDVLADNGIIHVIDAVLIPPSGSTIDEPDDTTGDDTDTTALSLLQIVQNDGRFTSLAAALEATGLDGALGHAGDQYTVFAPTDSAFAALGQKTIDALFADPDSLRDILLYHLITSNVVDEASAASLSGVPIQSGNGSYIILSAKKDSLFVNDTRIAITDIVGVNGVLHVIDSVLLPPVH